MKTTIEFERWELEFLLDCLPYSDYDKDVEGLIEKLVKARDTLKENE